METKPKIAQRGPYAVREEPGSKFWCACGLSKKQPYCDGSHRGSGISPIKVEFEETETVHYCGCKQSGKKPFCDGTHSRLPK